jgi:Arc/MetJ-type ribon-helix-helix transcriptional regulator
MKAKISISIEETSVDKLEEYVKEGQFRNKSHVIEYALNKFMKEQKK